MIKQIIIALKAQLITYPALAAYASDAGYIVADPVELVRTGGFPFFNVVPGNPITVEKVDNVSFMEMERHIIPLVIQFATRSTTKDVAVMGDDVTTGLLDFMEDLWDGIKFDRTIGGTVNGIVPGFTIEITILELEGEQRIFVAGAEMRIEIYVDKAA